MCGAALKAPPGGKRKARVELRRLFTATPASPRSESIPHR